MRKIRDSSNTSCTAALSCFDDSRSVPNGFSMITRAVSLASPVEPSISTTARERRRRHGQVEQPPDVRRCPFLRCPEAPLIAFSAASTADTSADGSSGDAAPNDSREANESQDSSRLAVAELVAGRLGALRGSRRPTARTPAARSR